MRTHEVVEGERVKVYDSGGCADRYTVALLHWDWDKMGPYYPCLGLSSAPDHPQGVSQFGHCLLGRHLGKRIAFADLPENVQAHIRARLSPERIES